jgi:hypothetical protein
MKGKDFLLTEPLPITISGYYYSKPSYLGLNMVYGKIILNNEELIFKPSSFRLFKHAIKEEFRIKINDVKSVLNIFQNISSQKESTGVSLLLG